MAMDTATDSPLFLRLGELGEKEDDGGEEP
jgi:hypothetical protein